MDEAAFIFVALLAGLAFSIFGIFFVGILLFPFCCGLATLCYWLGSLCLDLCSLNW